MLFMIRVAWRNLRRNRLRSFLAGSAIAVGVAFCMSATALMDGMFLQMFNVMVADKVGHVQLHHPDYPGRGILYDTEGEECETTDGRVGTTVPSGFDLLLTQQS